MAITVLRAVAVRHLLETEARIRTSVDFMGKFMESSEI